MPDQIDGHKVVRLLGEGGFGAVYLARDRNTNEPIAVKTLLNQRSATAEAETMFRREFSILELDISHAIRWVPMTESTHAIYSVIVHERKAITRPTSSAGR
jgi:serine/threonine protein kinase